MTATSPRGEPIRDEGRGEVGTSALIDLLVNWLSTDLCEPKQFRSETEGRADASGELGYTRVLGGCDFSTVTIHETVKTKFTILRFPIDCGLSSCLSRMPGYVLHTSFSTCRPSAALHTEFQHKAIGEPPPVCTGYDHCGEGWWCGRTGRNNRMGPV